MSQQFCLKWNNHTTNMLQVFENLLTTEALVDVTLACDGLSLKAHKMVLSACSPFFQSLFLENPCKHPIVIMKDMRYCDLKAIIDFMYRGEVNVSHDQLSALLKTAETLKVKGLAEVTGENRQASGIVQHEIIQQNASTPTPVPPSAQRTDTPPLQGKRKRGRPRKRSLSDSNRSDDEGVPPKIKETNSDIEELSGDASMEATSDNRSSGLPISCNSQSQVPIHSSNNVNTFSKSYLSTSQDPQGEEPSGDENEFEVEPSKLLEQTLTTENVPSNSHNSTGPITLPSVSGLEISRRSMSSTDSGSQALVPVSIPSDSLGSNVQGPDSPQDVKPQILSFDDPPISPVAGTSHGSDRSLMMYMDQSGVASIPGPSNFQDNSALVPHDSQPQVIKRTCKKGIINLESSIHLDRNTKPTSNLQALSVEQKETIKDNSNKAEVPLAENKECEIKGQADSVNDERQAENDELIQVNKDNVNRKTYCGRKCINLISSINQEPNPEPTSSLMQTTEPIIKETITEKEDSSKTVPMAETERCETQRGVGSFNVGRKSRNYELLLVNKDNVNGKTCSKKKRHRDRNTKPSNVIAALNVERKANYIKTMKGKDYSNKAEVPMAEIKECEAVNDETQAENNELIQVNKNNVNSRTCNKEQKKNLEPIPEPTTCLEKTINLKETIKEEKDSYEANVPMPESKESQALCVNDGGQTRKNKRKNKNEVNSKTYNLREKVINLDPSINPEPIPEPTTYPEQTTDLTPNLEETIKEESDSCEANVPMPESKESQAVCVNDGGQTRKNEVNKTTNLVGEKGTNLNSIGNQESNPSLEFLTKLLTLIKDENDSNEVPMAETVENEAQSSNNEDKRTKNLSGKKRKNVDPIISIAPSSKLGFSQLLAQFTNLEQTTSLEPEIKEENDSNQIPEWLVPMALIKESEVQSISDEAVPDKDEGQVENNEKRNKNKVKMKTNIVRKKSPNLDLIANLRSNLGHETTTSQESNIESDLNKVIPMDLTEKSVADNRKNEVKRNLRRKRDNPDLGGSHKDRDTESKKSQKKKNKVKRKIVLKRRKGENLEPVVLIEPFMNLETTASLEQATTKEPDIYEEKDLYEALGMDLTEKSAAEETMSEDMSHDDEGETEKMENQDDKNEVKMKTYFGRRSIVPVIDLEPITSRRSDAGANINLEISTSDRSSINLDPCEGLEQNRILGFNFPRSLDSITPMNKTVKSVSLNNENKASLSKDGRPVQNVGQSSQNKAASSKDGRQTVQNVGQSCQNAGSSKDGRQTVQYVGQSSQNAGSSKDGRQTVQYVGQSSQNAGSSKDGRQTVQYVGQSSQNAGSSKDGRQTVKNTSQSSKNEGKNTNNGANNFSCHQNDTCIMNSLFPFICEKCPYKARNNTYLQRHIANKHSVTLHACEFCKYKGKRLMSLKKHTLHKHPSKYDPKKFEK